jgi:hypothetical protein
MHTLQGGKKIMTQSAIKKIEEKIHRDGSLTEEKKAELLNLLATMNPETVKYSIVQAEQTESTVGRREYSTYASMRRGNKN